MQIRHGMTSQAGNSETPTFTTLRSLNSPDLNRVDNKIWGGYPATLTLTNCSIFEHVWHGTDQHIIHNAINSCSCTSRCLVWHWHIWLMTATMSPTAAAAFSDQQLTGCTHNTFGNPSFTAAGCGTIYHLSCDRTKAKTIHKTTQNIFVQN